MARRKQYKYHFIYKTVNLITNKFYVGMHSTHNLEDGYLGSGKILKYSVNKYGAENHQLEILEFSEDKEKLAAREKELVNEDILKDPLCMNLKIGGEGGWNIDQQKKGGKRMLEIVWNDPEFIKRKKEKGSITMTKNHKDGKIKIPDWTGKTHSIESKNKISETKIKNKLQKGEKNSQFGTCWIHNLELKKNKRIRKDELDNWKDWNLGMKMEFFNKQ
jgi:hypothetical protein